MSNTETKGTKIKLDASGLVRLFDKAAQYPLWVSWSLALALAGATFYLAYAYLVSPVSADNDSLREAIAQKKSKNDAADRIRADERPFDEEFAKLYLISEDAHRLLPPKAEATKVLEGVQAIAQANALKVERFSAASPPVQSGKLYEIAVTAQVTGKYRDIGNFLSNLAHHERVINVTGFDLRNKGSEQTLSLDLATYYAPPPQDLVFPDDIVKLAQTGTFTR